MTNRWALHLLPRSMDPHGHCKYSTEPKAQPWQDHWQQTVYPLHKPIDVEEGDMIRVYISHDLIHIWVTEVKKVDLPTLPHKRTFENKSDTSNLLTEIISPVMMENSCLCGKFNYLISLLYNAVF